MMNGLKNILVSSDYFIGKYVKNNLSISSTTRNFFKIWITEISQESLDKILEQNIQYT